MLQVLSVCVCVCVCVWEGGGGVPALKPMGGNIFKNARSNHLVLGMHFWNIPHL
jgi:hypothetical protein